MGEDDEWRGSAKAKIEDMERRLAALEARLWGIIIAGAFGAGKLLIDMIGGISK